jgi:prephenate dehydratase
VTRLAFLGPRATFCEQAALQLPLSVGAELVPCTTTTAALAAVRDKTADLACVPFENSVEGGVPAVLDALVGRDDETPLVIIAETQVAVRFALMARDGMALGDIRTVGSHPHGEAQVRHWLATNLPKASVIMCSSTAEAAAQVARGELDASASAPVAADVHGLKIVAHNIEDTEAAVTRFVLVSPLVTAPPPSGTDRTTLAATTDNVPGALLGILNELAVRGIDLTRIESRPIKGVRDEYWFHLDCAGHVAQPAMGEALAALHRRCRRVRYLGSYARSQPPVNAEPPVNAQSPVNAQAPVNASAGRVGDAQWERFSTAQEWLTGVRTGTRS